MLFWKKPVELLMIFIIFVSLEKKMCFLFFYSHLLKAWCCMRLFKLCCTSHCHGPGSFWLRVLSFLVFCIMLSSFVKDYSTSPRLFCSVLFVRFPPVLLLSVSSPGVSVYTVVWVVVPCFPLVFYSILFMSPPAHHVRSLPHVPSFPLVCLSTSVSCFPFYCEGPVFLCLV